MKSLSKFLSVAAMLMFLFLLSKGQEFNPTTKSPEALKLFKEANKHVANVEHELAYQAISRALQIDPNFTIAQVFIAGYLRGETKQKYEAKAKQGVSNKTAGEKLLVSLIGMDGDENRSARLAIWEKLRKMYPDERGMEVTVITYDTDSNKMLNNLLDFAKRNPAEASVHNILGYLYLLYKKDPATAKTHFEKYIQMYPEGYNPYDSMGEFYFITGDLEKSKGFYNKSLEHYPFCVSSLRKLEEIKEKEQGLSNK